MREKKRLLELAGINPKPVLSEAKEIQLQMQFDEPEDRESTMAALKKIGVKARLGGSVRGKAQDEFINVQVPSGPAKQKLLKLVADWFYSGDEEDAKDEYPELA